MHARFVSMVPLVAVLLLTGCERTPVTDSVASPVPAPESVAVDDDPPALAALRRDMPADVSDFIRRAVICNHWAGEEPYDEDRRAQIAAAVGSLRCRALDADQAALRGKYAGNAEALRRIDQSRRTPL